MYEIERVSEKHLNDWLEMMLSLWDDNSYEVSKAERIDILNHDGFGNFILLEDRKSIGFINMSLRHDYVSGANYSPVGFVEGVYIKPEYRKQGAAKLLMDHGFNWAKQMGCKQVGSDCLADDVASMNFHKAIGFADVEQVMFFIKDIN